MTAQEKRAQFFLKMKGLDCPILGSVVFWNVRNVSITKDEFTKLLEESGLPTKYAREHNYRSAFIRALRNLEEGRIIRRVSEDDDFIVFQFTAEQLTGTSVGSGELKYTTETRVIVSKSKYYETKNFAEALISEMPGYTANAAINKLVLELFEKEKVRYNSSDITRYLQRIIEEEADLITLRDQGNVYFVPAQFNGVVEKVSTLVSKLSPNTNDARFEYLPVPDAEVSKVTLGRSVLEELESVVKGLAEEVDQLSPDLTDKGKITWMEARLRKVKRLKDRIEMYGEIVPDVKVKELNESAEELAQRILNVRKLEI